MDEKVFVSYAHSSPEFSDKVLDFLNTLRKLGVDCDWQNTRAVKRVRQSSENNHLCKI